MVKGVLQCQEQVRMIAHKICGCVFCVWCVWVYIQVTVCELCCVFVSFSVFVLFQHRCAGVWTCVCKLLRLCVHGLRVSWESDIYISMHLCIIRCAGLCVWWGMGCRIAEPWKWITQTCVHTSSKTNSSMSTSSKVSSSPLSGHVTAARADASLLLRAKPLQNAWRYPRKEIEETSPWIMG